MASYIPSKDGHPSSWCSLELNKRYLDSSALTYCDDYILLFFFVDHIFFSLLCLQLLEWWLCDQGMQFILKQGVYPKQDLKSVLPNVSELGQC